MTCPPVPSPLSTYLPRFPWVRLIWRCTWKRCREERQSRVTVTLLQQFHKHESCIIMSNVIFFFFLFPIDVLEVLTEVDDKSRRSPEIIQYFTVSHKQQKQKVRCSTCQCVTCQSPPCVTVCRTICRDSWLPLKSCVGTWPSAWPYVASRIIPGKSTEQMIDRKYAGDKRRRVSV